MSDESESNIDCDFDVDPTVMSNVNAVIENGVLEVEPDNILKPCY